MIKLAGRIECSISGLLFYEIGRACALSCYRSHNLDEKFQDNIVRVFLSVSNPMFL